MCFKCLCKKASHVGALLQKATMRLVELEPRTHHFLDRIFVIFEYISVLLQCLSGQRPKRRPISPVPLASDGQSTNKDIASLARVDLTFRVMISVNYTLCIYSYVAILPSKKIKYNVEPNGKSIRMLDFDKRNIKMTSFPHKKMVEFFVTVL